MYNNITAQKKINPRKKDLFMKLSREYLREVSFPVGGIGAGCIGVAGNGRLTDWEIFNEAGKGRENGCSPMQRCIPAILPVSGCWRAGTSFSWRSLTG